MPSNSNHRDLLNENEIREIRCAAFDATEHFLDPTIGNLFRRTAGNPVELDRSKPKKLIHIGLILQMSMGSCKFDIGFWGNFSTSLFYCCQAPLLGDLPYYRQTPTCGRVVINGGLLVGTDLQADVRDADSMQLGRSLVTKVSISGLFWRVPRNTKLHDMVFGNPGKC